MPIPFLLAGLGVAAGVLGVGGHLSANETNERAQQISDDALNLYNNAKMSLEKEQKKTETSLLRLGYAKKRVLDGSMKQFVDYYEKIKDISINESKGLNELSHFSIDQQDVDLLQEMSNIYSSSIASGTAGVATGAVIALAVNGTLPLVTGGLSVAGSALAAGQIGVAAGMASSALSLGVSMTPLAAVAAPVVFFTGLSASIKADENLEKAEATYAEAEAAVEKMKTTETVCMAIVQRADMFHELMLDLEEMFSECVTLMRKNIRWKLKHSYGKQLTSKDFSEDELKLIAVTRALAGAVKSVIDTPILTEKGDLDEQSEKMYDYTSRRLNDFYKATKEVKSGNYEM